MAEYYECHVTLHGRPEDIRPHVENLGWKFSAIDGDLGVGVKCYATIQFNVRLREVVVERVSKAGFALRAKGLRVLREKVELVTYDKRYKCT